MTIHVLQGERKQAGQNKSLGRFDLADIPPSPRGMPQIEVAFDIDANGILNVSAKDKATGKEQSIVIKASSGLSDEEIEKMVKDAEANADADKQFEELITARNTADGMIHATKKSMAEAGDKLSAEEKAPVEAAITELEEALKTEDKESITAKTTALTEASAKIAEKLYAAADAGASDTGPDTGSPKPEDDVVDAEFEEVKDDEKK